MWRGGSRCPDSYALVNELTIASSVSRRAHGSGRPRARITVVRTQRLLQLPRWLLLAALLAFTKFNDEALANEVATPGGAFNLDKGYQNRRGQ